MRRTGRRAGWLAGAREDGPVALAPGTAHLHNPGAQSSLLPPAGRPPLCPAGALLWDGAGSVWSGLAGRRRGFSIIFITCGFFSS